MKGSDSVRGNATYSVGPQYVKEKKIINNDFLIDIYKTLDTVEIEDDKSSVSSQHSRKRTADDANFELFLNKMKVRICNGTATPSDHENIRSAYFINEMSK